MTLDPAPPEAVARDLLGEARVHPIDHVMFLVPARNEEGLLPACLSSITAVRARLEARGITTRLVVAVDASTDDTLAVARSFATARDEVLVTAAGCVGTARALATGAALRGHDGPLERVWLANTDADCLVPLDWLDRHLAYAHRGAAAVAGIIDVVDFAGHHSIVEARFRATYPIHDDGTHPNVHGANLGVRADAYVRAGGWAPLSSAEDHDLWRRLVTDTVPALLVRDAYSVVITSGRRVGRAGAGFAEALGAHNPDPVSGPHVLHEG